MVLCTSSARQRESESKSKQAWIRQRGWEWKLDQWKGTDESEVITIEEEDEDVEEEWTKTKFDQWDKMKREHFNAQFAVNYIGKLAK